MYPYTTGASKIEASRYDNWEQYPDARFQDFFWPASGERLTRELFAKYRKIGGTMIYPVNTEDVVSLALAHPLTMIASDGGPMHPRGSGTYAKVLGRYVREQKALTLVDALRKMTIMPARRLEKLIPAMLRKGRITVGADADITVFDPERVIDAATYEAPATASIGIQHVLVGGQFVVRDARLQAGVFPGHGIRAR